MDGSVTPPPDHWVSKRVKFADLCQWLPLQFDPLSSTTAVSFDLQDGQVKEKVVLSIVPMRFELFQIEGVSNFQLAQEAVVGVARFESEIYLVEFRYPCPRVG